MDTSKKRKADIALAWEMWNKHADELGPNFHQEGCDGPRPDKPGGSDCNCVEREGLRWLAHNARELGLI